MCLVMRWGFVSRTSPNLEAQYMSAHFTTSQYSWLLISTCCLLVYLLITLRTGTESQARYLLFFERGLSHTREISYWDLSNRNNWIPNTLLYRFQSLFVVNDIKNQIQLLRISLSDSFISRYLFWYMARDSSSIPMILFRCSRNNEPCSGLVRKSDTICLVGWYTTCILPYFTLLVI